MNKKLETIGVVLAGLMLAVVLYFYSVPRPEVAFGTVNISVSKMTNGGVLCNPNTWTQVVGTSASGRNLFYVSNLGSTAELLDFGTTASSTGVLLAASSTLRMDSVGSYNGAIYCETLGGTATTTYSDSQN